MNKTKFYPILLVGYKNIFMKNLYLLKTDKLSKLHKTIPKNNLILTTEYKFSNKWENYHLYVVSDEEVKNDDYFIVNEKFIQRCVKSYENWLKNNKDNLRYTIKKIILTTDLDLINDNIQAIDDEFLNWWVNNSNCEYVDLGYDLTSPMGRKVDSMNVSQNHSQCTWKYKIIIPQEKPKHIPYTGIVWEPPKFESVQEAAENYAYDNFDLPQDSTFSTMKNSFSEGAKYIQKRMYSEEEILEQLNYLMKLPSSEFDKFTDDSGNITKKWFKTYKKKNE